MQRLCQVCEQVHQASGGQRGSQCGWPWDHLLDPPGTDIPHPLAKSRSLSGDTPSLPKAGGVGGWLENPFRSSCPTSPITGACSEWNQDPWDSRGHQDPHLRVFLAQQLCPHLQHEAVKVLSLQGQGRMSWRMGRGLLKGLGGSQDGPEALAAFPPPWNLARPRA